VPDVAQRCRRRLPIAFEIDRRNRLRPRVFGRPSVAKTATGAAHDFRERTESGRYGRISVSQGLGWVPGQPQNLPIFRFPVENFAMNVFANASPARSLRRVAVRDLYGVSLSTIDRLVKAGTIRSRRVGCAVLLKAEDCEKAFGWPEDAEVEPSARDLAEMAKLVG